MIVSLISGGTGYLSGAMALASSIIDHDPGVDMLLLAERGAYTARQLKMCENAGWDIDEVDPVRSPDCKFRAARWPMTFTKLHVWGVDADKVIYLDADCLVVRPFYDDLIDRKVDNVGACWVKRGNKNRWNSGMMVLEPNTSLRDEMIHEITTFPPEQTDAAMSDQGYLNLKFRRWTQLPDKFNWRWWDRWPGDLRIAHIRPHPWRFEKTKQGTTYSAIHQQWKDSLHRSGVKKPSQLDEMTHRSDFGDLLNSLGLNSKGVEVGVAHGRNAEGILKKWKSGKIYLVDPYRRWPSSEYVDPVNRQNPKKLLRRCRARLSRHKGRYSQIFKDSQSAVKQFSDNSLDFVYIDANHHEPQISADLLAWWPKVKPGGIFGGHDFYMRDTAAYRCDVEAAVTRFASDIGRKIHVTNCMSWWIQK